MDKCCTSLQRPRSQRRINGLQLPLNIQQVMGWIVFVITTLINFVLLLEIQFKELKVISIIIFVILYLSHISSHIAAVLIDPSERELRKLKVNNVPEFDRSVHAHVIENGRCHLCNIYTSSKHTKHCSLCNKCVDRFDHHCKWLNNCVGQRNYAAFIACVISSIFISLFTTILCVTDIALFFVNPNKLSVSAQNFINCTVGESSDYENKYCRSSISFLVFLIIFGLSALAIACALLHLCCFHVYISFLGVSTYEYIVKSGSNANKPKVSVSETSACRNRCCFHHRSKKYQADSSEGSASERKNSKAKVTKSVTKGNRDNTNVTNMISVLIATELNKARKIFLYDKNKIHPQEENST